MEWNMKKKTFTNMDRIIRYVKRPEVSITKVYSYIPKPSIACFLHVRRKLVQLRVGKVLQKRIYAIKILDVYG